MHALPRPRTASDPLFPPPPTLSARLLPGGRRRPSWLARDRPRAVYLDNLYAFDLVNMTWAKVSAANGSARPSARYWFGFTSDGDKLYLHAGNSVNGGERGRSGRWGLESMGAGRDWTTGC